MGLQCKITEIIKNYNLRPILDKLSTKQFLYYKIRSQTKQGCNNSISDTNYTLLIPDNNNNMKINDVSCIIIQRLFFNLYNCFGL